VRRAAEQPWAAAADEGNEAVLADPGDAPPRSVGADRGTGPRRPWWPRLFVGALILVTLAVAAWAVLGSSLLVVRHVAVTGAGPLVPAATVRSAAAIPLRTPLARVDTAAAARRVERLAPVLSARVTRSFPDTVVIAVRQRTPVLAVAAVSGYRLIDEHGVAVTTVSARPAGLPLLIGTAPARGSAAVRAAALVVLRLPADLRSRVTSVSATASVTLYLSGGITVIWGDAGHAAQKAAELEVMLGTTARTFDVSDPATAVAGQ